VRDHVLGCTVVAGDGRVIEAGGRVVKNVAGYDLTRLQVGAFGAFGVITSLHLRLRAMPAADVTLLARGERDRLTHAARGLVAAAASLASLELFSPALAADAEWALAVRCLGPAEAAGPEVANLMAMTDPAWERLPADRAHAFWNQAARGPLVAPVSLRMGALLDGVDDLLDLLHEQLGEGLVSAGAGTGSIRWSGDATAEQLRGVRQVAAEREIPLTLERAPYDLRQEVGHFGAYREGVGQLVTRLRETFDPKGVLAVAVEGRDGR
jgi:glycolate oxidase FAD binding subunit